jgi:hypothetical protein
LPPVDVLKLIKFRMVDASKQDQIFLAAHEDQPAALRVAHGAGVFSFSRLN